jgi:hypothetical protein
VPLALRGVFLITLYGRVIRIIEMLMGQSKGWLGLTFGHMSNRPLYMQLKVVFLNLIVYPTCFKVDYTSFKQGLQAASPVGSS